MSKHIHIHLEDAKKFAGFSSQAKLELQKLVQKATAALNANSYERAYRLLDQLADDAQHTADMLGDEEPDTHGVEYP